MCACLQETWSKLSHAAIVAAPEIASATLLQASENLGISLAEKLLDVGAAEILAEAKRQTASEIMRQKAEKQNAAGGATNVASSSS